MQHCRMEEQRPAAAWAQRPPGVPEAGAVMPQGPPVAAQTAPAAAAAAAVPEHSSPARKAALASFQPISAAEN